MINYFDITIALQHEPFGEERANFSEHAIRPTSRRRSVQIQLHCEGKRINVSSLNDGSHIRIRGCPLKVLQGHNVFGSDDVRLLASALICKVLDHLEIAYTDQQQLAWGTGDFGIDAIAITHRFPLPDHVTVKQLNKHMSAHTRRTVQPVWCHDAVGTHVVFRSLGETWLFHDTLQEIKIEKARAAPHLRAIVGDDVDDVLDRLGEEASGTAHVELRVYEKRLAKLGLNRGTAWTPARAHELYMEELSLFWLEDYDPIKRRAASPADIADSGLRRTVALWAHGEELADLFEPSMLEDHRSKILDAIGIDITHDAPVFEELSLEQIFCEENAMCAFPSWVGEHPTAAFNACPAPQKYRSANPTAL